MKGNNWIPIVALSFSSLQGSDKLKGSEKHHLLLIIITVDESYRSHIGLCACPMVIDHSTCLSMSYSDCLHFYASGSRTREFMGTIEN